MGKIKAVLCLAVVMILLGSCTLQKRTFRKGYYVHWNSQKIKDKESNYADLKMKEPLIASTDASFFIPARSTPPGDSIKKTGCGDSIWLKNGSIITGKVVRKPPFALRILPCGSDGKKTAKIYRVEVKKIRYYKEKKPVPSQTEARTARTFAFWFFMCGVISLMMLLLNVHGLWILPLIAGAVFYILTWISSLLALRKIKKEPEKYSGMKMALFALYAVAIYAILLLVTSAVIAFVFFL